MKRLMATTLGLATAASAFALLALTPTGGVEASPHWRGHSPHWRSHNPHWRGHNPHWVGHHWRPRVGVYIGAPVLPYYYHPRPFYDPYYHPPVIVREQPITYIEQAPPVVVAPAPAAPPAPSVQAQQPLWFYCQDTQTYFPHVQTCASPWMRVIPHTPQQP